MPKRAIYRAITLTTGAIFVLASGASGASAAGDIGTDVDTAVSAAVEVVEEVTDTVQEAVEPAPVEKAVEGAAEAAVDNPTDEVPAVEVASPTHEAGQGSQSSGPKSSDTATSVPPPSAAPDTGDEVARDDNSVANASKVHQRGTTRAKRSKKQLLDELVSVGQKIGEQLNSGQQASNTKTDDEAADPKKEGSPARGGALASTGAGVHGLLAIGASLVALGALLTRARKKKRVIPRYVLDLATLSDRLAEI